MTLEPQSSSLFSMARNKLQSTLGVGAKDSCSLHRWVLLKNSMIRSHHSDVSPLAVDKAGVQYVYRQEEEEEGRDDEEEDSFMFPDPEALLGSRDADMGDSENQWLDSVLETLGDDEDDGPLSDSMLREDDELLSPLYSPMSSSDDLVTPSDFYSIAVPYPVPYPPLHPPLIPAWFDMETSPDAFDASPPLYHDPLPYYDVDDVEDLPVPDAIEDTSDDESEAPSTPFTQSTSSASPSHPSSIPLPAERRPLHSRPHVYIDADSSYFYPFHFDSFPPDDHIDSPRAYHSPIYQDC